MNVRGGGGGWVVNRAGEASCIKGKSNEASIVRKDRM